MNGGKLQLLGIENRLEQVLANLLDNAVSFSPQNSTITIDVDSSKEFLSLKIKDLGPGFNEVNTEKKSLKDFIVIGLKNLENTLVSV